MKDIWYNLELLKDIEEQITSIDINGNFEGKIEKKVEADFYGRVVNDGYFRIVNMKNNPFLFDDTIITMIECEGISNHNFQAIKYYDNTEDYAAYGDDVNESAVVKTLKLLEKGISDDEIKEILDYSYFRSYKQKKHEHTKVYKRDYNE